MRRGYKAVMDVLDSMISDGVTLARSVELTAQWGKILSIGPRHPVTLDDLHAIEGSGLGDFRRVVGDFHHRLSDFVHGIVVHRREVAIQEWRNWVHPYKWLRPDLVSPAPFLQCKPHRTPGASGYLVDPARIDEEFRKVWLWRRGMLLLWISRTCLLVLLILMFTSLLLMSLNLLMLWTGESWTGF